MKLKYILDLLLEDDIIVLSVDDKIIQVKQNENRQEKLNEYLERIVTGITQQADTSIILFIR